ncbi:MAG TPA: hypothetical protein VEL74_03745 [Thermoanaerobaculia bacterium]|nr:hypothetical protein [Thermoanaerobaculia bacterium]
MRSTLLAALCVALFAPLLQAEPVQLADVDPLTLSIPDTEVLLPKAAADIRPAD